jgi:2-keto-4-pentenoate hydratase/2-oxohepta-3-ene-1,7-dioic acid hydratase in catechol pathway
MRITANLLFLVGFSLVVSAQRFVRFISDDGNEYYGDAILPANTTDAAESTSARVIQGDILGDFNITNQVKVWNTCGVYAVVHADAALQEIKTLLAPLPSERVRTVRCVGFNYVAHINEVRSSRIFVFRPIPNEKLPRQTNGTIPGWPILFYKPWTALNTPSDPIPISEGYQNQTNFTSTLDYETELVIVMKKEAFNISDDEALDHILGYTVGHDVSHRGWQIDRGGEPMPQYSMGKGADGWAPWGPAIVSTNIIPDPQVLNIWTKVNGVTQQNSTTANMIFPVKHLVSFFSMGTTLLPGDVIFTGT